MLCFRRGDASRPRVEGPKVIAHVCNDLGRWGKGFEKALSSRFPQAERAYRAWVDKGVWQDEPFGLGGAQVIEIPKTNVVVVNMLAQHGVKTRDGVPPIRYGALETALHKLQIVARKHDASVHMPRIGVGPAGGDWVVVEQLIEKLLGEFHVFIYDVAKPKAAGPIETASEPL